MNALWYGDLGLGQALYAGGFFPSAGGISANNIAKWDIASQNWIALGSGLDVLAFTSVNLEAIIGFNGELYAGGRFAFPGVGNTPVAVWDGVQWSDASAGLDPADAIFDFCIYDSGNGAELYAAGVFLDPAPESSQYCLAKWTGTSWMHLGAILPADEAHRLTVFEGNLIVGGEFESVDGITANGIAS